MFTKLSLMKVWTCPLQKLYLALMAGRQRKQARGSLMEAAHGKIRATYHNEGKFMTSPKQPATSPALTSLRNSAVYIPRLSNLSSITS